MRLLKRIKSSWQSVNLFGKDHPTTGQSANQCCRLFSGKPQSSTVGSAYVDIAKRAFRSVLFVCSISTALLPWSYAQAASYSYSDTSVKAIPDDSPNPGLCGTIMTQTINVADNFTISDVDVGLVIEHTYKSDLHITLTSPIGTTAVLFNRAGTSRDDLNILFDDAASTTVANIHHDASSAYPQYTRQPNGGALSIFNGENANGNWTLNVCDTYPDDFGSLSRFQLEMGDGISTPPPKFECTADADAYMFQIPDASASLVSQVNTLNLVTGEYIGAGTTLSAHINGQGYNIKDDYIWGYNITLDNGSISRIAADGSVANYAIAGLPAGRFLVGDIDSNGHLYLTSYGLLSYYVIDLDPASPNYLTLINTVNVSSVEYGDWAFNPIDGKLYSVTVNDEHSLVRVDPTTGVEENLGLTGIPSDGVIGATYFDSNGFMYGYFNTDGSIYRFDISDPVNINPQGVLFSQGTSVEFNDGARCVLLPVAIDFGDAPDSYGTALANNGARHAFRSSSNVYLGSVRPDSETDAQIDVNAAGDNSNGTNDEEAFVSLPNLDISSSSYSLTVPCNGNATVAGWIDFNQSGTFESGELDASACSSGSASLSWSGLSGLSAGQTYARFRIASNTSEVSNPTGSANDGEVEDYQLTINGPVPPSTGHISGTVYNDSNSNNTFDFGTETGISSITVTLQNNADSSTISTSSTASDGSYSFTGLDSAMNYNLVVDVTDSDLSGKTLGTTNPLTGVTVTADNTTTNQNFGFDNSSVPVPQPFVCDANIYIAKATSEAVPSQFSSIDTSTSPFTLNDIGDTSHGHNFNAMGYRDQDNLIYGIKLGTSNLIRIDANGTIQDLGAITGLPVPANIWQVYDSGDVFPDGFLYIHEVTSHPEIYKIDVTTTPPQLVQTINLSQSIWLSDFAYNAFDNKVYGIGDQGEKYMIDPATWAVSTVGANAPAASYGAVYTDNQGNVYTYKNNPGTFYQVDFGLNGTGTGDLIELSTAPNVAFNDGASCRGAPPIEPPVEPEVEFCTYNLDVAYNETFNIRDYVRFKDDTPINDWSNIGFTYTDAGANDPTNPADWNLSNFNNGTNVTVSAADAASGTGNKGDGRYRLYLVRNGQLQYDDAMTIRVSASDSDLNSAKCIPETLYGDIQGAIFEDPNYGGGAGRPRSTAGTLPTDAGSIELYDAAGNFVSSVTSTGGNYSFTNIAEGEYYIRVVGASVSSARPGSNGAVIGVQTFRSNGTVDTVNEVGGRNPAVADASTNNGSSQLDTSSYLFTSGTLAGQQAQTVQPVILTQAGLTGVDFGFNFSTIVNKNDAGQGSLRQFVTNANILDSTNLQQSLPASIASNYATAGHNVSIFMIPASDVTAGDAIIPIGDTLNIRSQKTVLDGRTQLINVGTGDIIVDSLDSAVDRIGLTFEATADYSVLRYLTIQNIGGSAVVSAGLNANKVDGLIIEQNTIRNNGQAGVNKAAISSQYTDNSLIQNNIITENNGNGIWLANSHDGNTLANNTITVNQDAGIVLEQGVNNTTINNNIIVNNIGYGMVIRDNSENNILRQNTLTDNGISNAGYGIQVVNASSNTYTENTISGHGGIGLHLSGTTALSIVENNIIQNNGGDGVYLQGNAQLNILRQNTIENNAGAGIRHEAGNGNSFTQNAIFSNGELGIDLGAIGVTPNDDTDVDTGPNDLLNHPVLISAITTIETVNFDLDVPAGNYVVEFFSNNNGADPSGHGEGQSYIGSVAITHPGGGNQSFTEIIAGLNAASLVSSTISEDLGGGNLGSTSEFSGNISPLLETDLKLEKRLASGQSHTINSGEYITFTLTVSNESGTDVSNVQLVDYMPGALTLADANWTANGAKVTMNTPIASLAAGDSVSVDVRFIANNAIVQRNSQTRVGGVIVTEEVECRNGAEIMSFEGGVDKDSTPDDVEGNDGYEDDYASETFNVNGLCASPFDYGDAPDIAAGNSKGNYTTLESGDGPRHQVSDLLFMGNCADTDNGNNQSQGADADDASSSYYITAGSCTSPNDDEDGITPPTLNDSQIAPTVTVSVLNKTGHDVTLSCWVDYNADGVFDNATERGQVTNIISQLGNQDVVVTLPNVPDTAGNDTEGSTYLRCRLASGTDADNPTGAAADGEVEDYVIDITPRCILSAEVNNVRCSSDNSTIDPSDDLWDFDVRVTGTGVGTSPTWQVAGGVTANNRPYNQFESFVVGSIQGKPSIDVTFSDQIDSVCHVDSQIDAPASCSPSCDITIAASNVVRNCQGSASTADDTVSVDVTVAGAHSNWQLFREASTGDVNVGSYSGDITNTHTFNVADILANNSSGFTLSARESDYSDCTNNVFVNLPSCPSMPRLSIADSSIVEGNSGTQDLAFTVALGNDLQRNASATRAGSECTATKTVTESFDTNDILSTWDTVKYSWSSCNWSVVNGRLKEKSDSCKSLFVHPLDEALYNTESTHYDITARVDANYNHNNGDDDDDDDDENHGNNGVGITFGYTSKYNFYYVRWLDFGYEYESENGYKYRHLQIIKYTNGAPNILIEEPMNLPEVFDLKVTVSDEGIKVFVDNEEKLSAASEQPPLKRFGVSSRDNDDGVFYDNLVVNSHCSTAGPNTCQLGNGNTQFDNPFCVANDAEEVTVNYAVVDGSATIDNNDYGTVTVGTATVVAGQSTVDVTVPIIGDLDVEPDENFTIVLSEVLNAEPIDNLAVGTIINDDYPIASINDESIVEGDSGTKPLVFEVNLNSPAPIGGVTLDYTTGNITATTGNNDYQSASGTVTIPEGSSSGTISVTIIGDTVIEPDETFRLNLTNPVNVNLDVSEVIGTIINDDAVAPVVPSLSVADVTVNEGDSGTTPLTFIITQSAATSVDTTVSYEITDGTATLAGNDYQAAAQGLTGNVTIPAGSTQATVTLNVIGDTNIEPNETLNITLSSPVNATISDNTAVGTIVDNDSTPVIPDVRVSDMSVYEGDSGTTPLTFTITQSTASTTDTTVSYVIADDTATVANNDYQAGAQALSGTVVIPAGSTQATVTIDVIGDTNIEPDETLTITLSNPVNANIVDNLGIGSIVDDDGNSIPNCAQIITVDQAAVFPENQASCITIPRRIPTINASISDASTVEGNSGTKTLDFTVTLDSAHEEAVSLDYSTTNGTATTGNNDYQSTTGTLTIPAGSITGTISVTIVGDTDVEADETFQLILSNPVNVNLSTTQVTGTIVNDDSTTQAISLKASKVADKTDVSSGDTVVFTLTVSNIGATAATNILTSDVLPAGMTYVSDTSGGGYNPSTGEWRIGALPAGQSSSINITVTIN